MAKPREAIVNFESEVFNEIFERAKAVLVEAQGAEVGASDAGGIARQASERAAQLWADGWEPAPAKAAGFKMADDLVNARLKANGKPEIPGVISGAAAGGSPTAGEGAVTSKDVKDATDAYRGGIERGQGLYGEIQKDPVNDPNARNVGRKVVGYRPKFDAKGQPVWKIDPATGKPLIDPNAKGAGPDGGLVQELEPVYGDFEGVQQRDVTATQQGEVAPIDVARQDKTTIAATDVADLQATARGGGAANAAALLRDKLAAQRNAQVASGAAAQARGSERRGARGLGILQGAEDALRMHDQSEGRAQDAALVAQGKLADLDAATKKAQADLDAAKAANDQAAINAANNKLADLRAKRDEFNAGEANRVAQQNADRGVRVGETNLREERLGIESGSRQDIDQAKLRMDAQKALEDSAKGLLDEAQRQELIRQWQAKYELAKKEFEEAVRRQARAEELQARQQTMAEITAVITGLTSAATKVAGVSDRRLKQDISPVEKGDLAELAAVVRDSMATWGYKPGHGLPEGEQVGPMAQDLEQTKLGRAVVAEDADGVKRVDTPKLAITLAGGLSPAKLLQLALANERPPDEDEDFDPVALLAAHNLRARKEAR